MPSQRTGGRPVKIHRLQQVNREMTLCGRNAMDVAFARLDAYVTCRRCLEALYGKPDKDDGTGMSADEKAWLG